MNWRRARTIRGHYTMEACRTSQFEQHVRAICNLPLGDTDAADAGRHGQCARRACGAAALS